MRAFKLKKGEKIFLENSVSVMLKQITFDDVVVDIFVGKKRIKNDCKVAFGAELPLSEGGKDFFRAVKRNHDYEAEFYICTSQLNFTDAEKYENKINPTKMKQKQTIVKAMMARTRGSSDVE